MITKRNQKRLWADVTGVLFIVLSIAAVGRSLWMGEEVPDGVIYIIATDVGAFLTLLGLNVLNKQVIMKNKPDIYKAND